MLLNYFKIAWRTLIKYRIYTIINILGLSLGICACLILFLITHYELGYDKFHPEKEKIYRVVADRINPTGEHRQLGFLTDPMAMTIRSEISGLATVSAIYNYYTKISIPDGDKMAIQLEKPKFGIPSDVIITDPQYFDIFKYQWLAGSPAVSITQPFQVVLSENESHKYFGPGTPDQFIGRQVIYSDSLRMTVAGIVKDWTGNTDLAFKDFISAATIEHSFLKKNIDLHWWGMWNYTTQAFVKLSPGTSAAQVQRQFGPFAKRHIQSHDGDRTEISLQPLSDLHFNAGYEDSYSRKVSLPTLYALMGVAAFILLIAVINFINLSTAQSIQRFKEIGIRKVLGSRRRNLVFQFLIETFILTAVAVIISVLLVNPVLFAFHAFVPPGLTFHLTAPSTLLFLVSITLVTSLLAGFYPARVLSSYLPVISLKGNGAQHINQKSYLRQSLIVFQFTIALLFIIGTAIIGDQIHFLLSQDMGFTRTAIINIPVSPRGRDTIDRKGILVQRMRLLPQVSGIALSEGTPAATRHRGTDIKYTGKDLVKTIVEMHVIDDKFIPFYDIKILAGRNLRNSDTMNEILLNETCARALGFKDPQDAIGQLVDPGQKDGPNTHKLPVVGVVADFHSRSLRDAVSPVFLTCSARGNNLISVKLSLQGKGTAGIKNTLAAIEKEWKAVYPDNKFDYTFFDETIAAFYDKEQKTAQIMNTAMLISIFISCLGLFGVTTFMAGQRTREIGIRKVLGASVTGIVQMLSIDFVRLVGISIVIASPIAYYFMHRWLQDFAYRITISAWVFIWAGLAALFIALATVSFQAIRAAVANPVKSLRSE